MSYVLLAVCRLVLRLITCICNLVCWLRVVGCVRLTTASGLSVLVMFIWCLFDCVFGGCLAHFFCSVVSGCYGLVASFALV